MAKKNVKAEKEVPSVESVDAGVAPVDAGVEPVKLGIQFVKAGSDYLVLNDGVELTRLEGNFKQPDIPESAQGFWVYGTSYFGPFTEASLEELQELFLFSFSAPVAEIEERPEEALVSDGTGW